jgi:hypothetical protein
MPLTVAGACSSGAWEAAIGVVIELHCLRWCTFDWPLYLASLKILRSRSRRKKPYVHIFPPLTFDIVNFLDPFVLKIENCLPWHRFHLHPCYNQGSILPAGYSCTTESSFGTCHHLHNIKNPLQKATHVKSATVTNINPGHLKNTQHLYSHISSILKT